MFTQIKNIAVLTLQCKDQTPWNQQTVTHVNLRILLKTTSHICAQAMLPALEAILGHRSAHSLATGPVIAEPTRDNKNNLALHRSKTQNIRVKMTGLKKNMFHHGLRFNSTWRLPSHPTAMGFTIPSLTTHPATEQTKQVL